MFKVTKGIIENPGLELCQWGSSTCALNLYVTTYSNILTSFYVTEFCKVCRLARLRYQ